MTPERGTDEWRDYCNMHHKVRTARGKASEKYCVSCSKKALDWAQIHGTNGASIEDYQPMCRKCHRDYDDVSSKVGPKIAVANKGNQYRLGIPHDEVSRQSMRAAQQARRAREKAGK